MTIRRIFFTLSLATTCVAIAISCSPKISAAGDNAGVSIADKGKSGSFDCKNGNASITGTDHDVTLKNCRVVVVTGQDIKLTLKGDCTQIVVTGNAVEAHVDAVEAITATGNDIKVTWKKALGTKAPQVTSIGNDVRVTQAR